MQDERPVMELNGCNIPVLWREIEVRLGEKKPHWREYLGELAELKQRAEQAANRH